MGLCKCGRAVRAWATIVLGLLVLPSGAWAAMHFAPGVWQGRAPVTGGFSGRGVRVHVTRGTFAFCLTVAPDGAVTQSKSKWVDRLTLTERISSAGHVVTATGIANGGGTLKGHGNGVKVKGTQIMKLTFIVDGHHVTTSAGFSVSTTMPITTASPRRVTGDIALKARTAQQHAGFSSDERALYVARRVTRCTL